MPQLFSVNTTLTKAQKQLYQALNNLLAKKPVEMISVSSLVTEAHISRSTFYLYYDNVRELYEAYLSDLVAELSYLANHVEADADPYHFIFIKITDFILENRRHFQNLLIERYDAYFVKLWKAGIGHTFLNYFPDLSRSSNIDLKFELVTAQFIAGITYLLKHDNLNIIEMDYWMKATIHQLLN